VRPVRPSRGDGPPPDTELPQGDSHAAAAPSELIWGRHAALAALESERPIHRIWCTPEMRFRPTFLQLLREAKASGVLVEEVTWARLGQISGGAVHQGIVLQPAAADTLDLPSLIDGCRQLGESPLLVAVDGLTDPQNLGAILRSAEALGVHGLVLPQRRNAGLTGSVAKVAAGALEHLPVARVVNLNRSLETLRQEGYRVVGLDPQGSVSLEEADLEGPLVVITGSEGQGLSVLTRRSCDQLVRIPLRGTTPSLNASVATALVLYEVARRGWMRGLKGMAKPPRLVRPNVPTEAPLSDSQPNPFRIQAASSPPAEIPSANPRPAASSPPAAIPAAAPSAAAALSTPGFTAAPSTPGISEGASHPVAQAREEPGSQGEDQPSEPASASTPARVAPAHITPLASELADVAPSASAPLESLLEAADRESSHREWAPTEELETTSPEELPTAGLGEPATSLEPAPEPPLAIAPAEQPSDRPMAGANTRDSTEQPMETPAEASATSPAATADMLGAPASFASDIHL
jgi:23S rRNA (guanosine2251-2'-O)-methyltransferase